VRVPCAPTQNSEKLAQMRSNAEHLLMVPSAAWEPFSDRGWEQGRQKKNFQGWSMKKRPKNSTIKPLSNIYVPSMKIQKGTASLSLAAYAHGWEGRKYKV